MVWHRLLEIDLRLSWNKRRQFEALTYFVACPASRMGRPQFRDTMSTITSMLGERVGLRKKKSMSIVNGSRDKADRTPADRLVIPPRVVQRADGGVRASQAALGGR